MPPPDPRIADLQRQLQELRALLRRAISSGATLDTRPVIAAWDDSSPRQFIGVGEAIAEGTGIIFTRVPQTNLIKIATTEVADNVGGITPGEDGQAIVTVLGSSEWAYLQYIKGYLQAISELPDEEIGDAGVLAGEYEGSGQLRLEDENGVIWTFSADEDSGSLLISRSDEDDPFLEVDEDGNVKPIGNIIMVDGKTVDGVDVSELVTVRKNSGTNVGTRPRINLIEGSNVTVIVTDDATSDEVDITIEAAGGIAGTAPGVNTVVIKSANETVTSSTALQNDNELLFAIDANKTLAFDFVLFVSGFVGGEIKTSFTIPAGVT